MNTINYILLALILYYIYKLNIKEDTKNRGEEILYNDNNKAHKTSNFHEELKSWTDLDHRSHPNFYKNDKESKITNIGGMFDSRLDYIDKKYMKEGNKYKQPIIRSSKKVKGVVMGGDNKLQKIYEDEKIINGGSFYNDVMGYDLSKSNIGEIYENINNLAY